MGEIYQHSAGLLVCRLFDGCTISAKGCTNYLSAFGPFLVHGPFGCTIDPTNVWSAFWFVVVSIINKQKAQNIKEKKISYIMITDIIYTYDTV